MKVIILNAYQVGSESTCHPQAGEHKKLSATTDYDNEDNCVVILEKNCHFVHLSSTSFTPENCQNVSQNLL